VEANRSGISDTKLKAKIDAWVNERREAVRAEKAMKAADGDVMDIDG
jgi:hypothetical protein